MKKCGCTRRQIVRSLVAGSMLLPGILKDLLAADPTPDDLNPLAPKKPHFPGKAKRVIFLYMTGGVSHMDSFDYKPRLFSEGGKPVNKSNPNGAKYVRPLWNFKRHGKCGMEV